MHRICVILISISIAGCASTLRREMEVDSFLAAKNYTAAREDLSSNESAFGNDNRLLYLYNKGAVEHYSGNFKESNEYFLQANDLSEDLYTKRISDEAIGLMNPNKVPYDGEDYEKVLVNTLMALNYFKMEKLEDALVEARRIDAKLELLTQEYESENKYKNDAFGRYLSGILYEKSNDLNNAFISYVKAYQAYNDYSGMFEFTVPDQIKLDILRLARLLHFDDEYEAFSIEFGMEQGEDPFTERSGEIILVIMTGLGPYKREVETSFTHVDKDGTPHTFQLLVPELIGRRSLIHGVDITLSSGFAASSFAATLAQDVEKIARKNMDDKKPTILLKAWLRAFAKFAGTEKAKKKTESGSKLLNILTGTAIDAVAKELTHADIRCWRTIPQKIYLQRIRVKPGIYNLRVGYKDEGNNFIGAVIKERIEMGEYETKIYYLKEFI